MRRIVPAVRRALVLLLALAIGVLTMVAPEAPPAQAAAGDPVSYAYDDAGRLVGATDPAGDTAKYNYDPAGNLTSIDRHPSSQVAILAFSPGRGPAGTKVTISGTGFAATAGDNTVRFNGTAATVTSATATRLVVTVPAGATTGPISVTAPGGSATSSDPFTVAASKAPTITGFSPATGPAGTTVTIAGTNFDTAELLNNVVAFNQARARVTAATSTSLTAEVPGAAGSGPISIRTPNGVGRSSEDFIIPPAPSTPADVEVSGRLTIGTAKTFTITTAGKIALQLFDGSEGQRVSVQITNATCCVYPNPGVLAVLKPDGSTLTSDSLTSPNAFLDAVTLPVDGTYTVLVDPDGTKTGSFTLTVHTMTDVTGTIAANGQPTTLSLSTPGQNGRYSLTGSTNPLPASMS